ncbi:methionine biosynthesis protein MetW [Hyphomicrobiales bacterium 4NK60-0047b]
MSNNQEQSNTSNSIRHDHLIIKSMISPNARVLDIGCGDGALLELLREEKNVDGRGIEINQKNVNHAVAKGLSVIQGDADSDLINYPDKSFDYAVLSLTIQATKNPRLVLEQLLRIADYAIVSFPNFGHWKIRWQILAFGRMPVTDKLPEQWYDTPNIHFCTVKDFATLCKNINTKVEEAISINGYGKELSDDIPLFIHNLLGRESVFLLSKNK